MIIGYAKFLAGPDIGIADRQGRNRHRDAKWSAIGMIIVGKTLIVFRPLVIGQDVAIAPAVAAILGDPCVVIGRIAARIKLGIDR
ncbi:hypothetical protein D3C78_1216780 [compost metagenome]